jgi:hypothetical protein
MVHFDPSVSVQTTAKRRSHLLILTDCGRDHSFGLQIGQGKLRRLRQSHIRRISDQGIRQVMVLICAPEETARKKLTK